MRDARAVRTLDLMRTHVAHLVLVIVLDDDGLPCELLFSPAVVDAAWTPEL